ncbi:MAG: ATP-binding protein [Syntrophobacteraceae bacterium]|nr:ATP-binding protein [Syntrophobacteraceae bacterium]
MSSFFKTPPGFLREALDRRFVMVMICVILTLFVGFLDYATNYQMDFFLFYFIPIAISAWFAGLWASAFLVLLSVGTWLIADILSNPQPSLWLIEAWNTGIQGVTFSLVALLTFVMRKAFDQKHEMNVNLSEALHKLGETGRRMWLAEQETARQNEFLRHVFESLPHPFYVVDADDGTVVMANSAASCGETGCGPEPLCSLEEMKKSGKPCTFEHTCYDKHGNKRHAEVHCYPILDAEGRVSQVIDYSLDITPRKQLEEILKNNADKIKLFAYSISHDLKSPLVGICGLAGLLHNRYKDVLDEKGLLYCDQLRKASQGALLLIEEINVFIRTKEAPMVFERVDMKELLRTVRNEFDPLLNTRAITWSEPELFPELTADRLSILRVFRNLVDNALKYGGNELSEISMGYEDSREYHTFFVSDNGAGFAGKECEKIFEPFQRCNMSRDVEGTGLGLSIVKEIAQKHLGSVRAEPGRSGGAVFYISISRSL